MVCSLYRTKGSEAIGKTKLHFSGVFLGASTPSLSVKASGFGR